MANTPQAKKRIRRNSRRELINHSRISRIRSFIKAVESAVESERKDEAAEAYRKGIEVATRRGDQHARRELEAALAEIAPA